MTRTKAQRKQAIRGKKQRRCKSSDLRRSSENFLELLNNLKIGGQYLGYEFTRNLFGKNRRWNSSPHMTGLQRERRRAARFNAAHHNKAYHNTARVGMNHESASRRRRRKPHQQAGYHGGRKNPTGQNNEKIFAEHKLRYFKLRAPKQIGNEQCHTKLELTKNMTRSEMSLYCDLLILEELERDDALHTKINKFCTESWSDYGENNSRSFSRK